MNLKIKSLFSAVMPLYTSVAEFAFCAVQNGIRSLLRICCSKLFGSFISQYHKNVTVILSIKIYIFSNFSFSSFSYSEHVLKEYLMCILPTQKKTVQDVINLEWHNILAMLINNQESGRL